MKLIQKDNLITTTVGDLIAELQKFDKDAMVLTEGCDCLGNVVNVSIDSEGIVLLERDDFMKDFVDGDYVLKEKYIARVVSR